MTDQKKRLNIFLIFWNGLDFFCILSGLVMIHFFSKLFAAIACFVIVFPPYPLILVLRRRYSKCFVFTQKSQSFLDWLLALCLLFKQLCNLNDDVYGFDHVVG